MDTLRLITCGNVDDGKSTLLGRLLHDTKSIFEDQWEAVQSASARRGDAYTDLALLTDGLRAEREQGITIDVAYRYFATPRRKFILADCPGHFQYTRNMVTGASSAQLALLLIDVRTGLTEQACRHAFLATLLRIKHLIVCVNKMDLVDFRQEEFDRVREQFMAYAERLEAADIQFIPMAALHGDNVAEKSTRMPWYEGASLLYTLETVYVRNDANHIDPRFPVQTVIRPQDPARPDFRGFAGQIASGVFRCGDEVVHLPSKLTARISGLHGPNGAIEEASYPMSIVMELDRDLAIGRSDLLAKPNNQPATATEFEAMLCWLGDRPLDSARRYLLRHTTRETKCVVRETRYKLDVKTLHRSDDHSPLRMNDLARVTIATATPIFFDSYRKNRQTGSLILIDEAANTTVAAGMIL
ncbi:sulfate adenylyltransferase subunit 1 [Oleiharenicola lentus]|uniref:sulfate adenylyltransferase subunit 1 n=1 Tax=Oleiharenicola lentus TaxID=2508720 RepID=UPI003F664BAF